MPSASVMGLPDSRVTRSAIWLRLLNRASRKRNKTRLLCAGSVVSQSFWASRARRTTPLSAVSAMVCAVVRGLGVTE